MVIEWQQGRRWVYDVYPLESRNTLKQSKVH